MQTVEDELEQTDQDMESIFNRVAASVSMDAESLIVRKMWGNEMSDPNMMFVFAMNLHLFFFSFFVLLLQHYQKHIVFFDLHFHANVKSSHLLPRE